MGTAFFIGDHDGTGNTALGTAFRVAGSLCS
jgi:hypothetical protein